MRRARRAWEMRATEGEALERDLRAQLAHIEQELEAIEARVPELVRAHHQRLEQRLAQLLRDRDVVLDAAR